LQIVDEAFADLETTTLHREDPKISPTGDEAMPSYQRATEQLAAQLLVLDEQRERVAKLLVELQASTSPRG
jgi:hypothetical protein